MTSRCLTVGRLTRYKAALVALALLAPAAGRAGRVAGAQLPDDARLIEPNRYRIDRSYEETLRYFRSVYPPARYPRKQIVSQPGLRATHIENPEPRPGSWDGLNVYELQGETRVFVLVAPGSDKEPKGRQDVRR